MDAIDRLLAPSTPRSFAAIGEFTSAYFEDAARFSLPVDRAIAGGALADRVGYAFAAGYAAALQALVPELGARTLASLAATEEGGAHPKLIRTTLTPREGGGFALNGHKGWVTLAGEVLLVLAKSGESPDGRAMLRVARVRRDAVGVRTTPFGEAPFVPEIPHAEIFFEDVRVAEQDVLPGDGWEKWVKPFRTVEDLHVHAALLAHLVALGMRSNWPHGLLERMLSTLVSVRALAQENPSSRAVHLALAGAIAQSRACIDETESLWDAQPADVRDRWRRDRALLGVAGKARAARTEKAWAK